LYGPKRFDALFRANRVVSSFDISGYLKMTDFQQLQETNRSCKIQYTCF